MAELKLVPKDEVRSEPAKFAAQGEQWKETLRAAWADRRCVCGRAKERRQPFCVKCKKTIPKDTRMGLDGPDLLTNAETYRNGVQWLEVNGYLGKGAMQSLFPEKSG